MLKCLHVLCAVALVSSITAGAAETDAANDKAATGAGPAEVREDAATTADNKQTSAETEDSSKAESGSDAEPDCD